MQLKSSKFAVHGAIGAAALLLAGVAQAAGVPGQGTWETTLLGRDIAGNAVAASSPSAVFLYDTTLDVTWLRDANVPGKIYWEPAVAWIGGLTVGAFSGWRLPTIVDTGAPGCDGYSTNGTDCGYNVQTKTGDPGAYEPGQTVYSEMAQLWYVELGNKAYCAPGDEECRDHPPGWGLTNTGTFQNMQADNYWAPMEGLRPPEAWAFDTNIGFQFDGAIGWGHVLAVRSGDVAAVPEPETYALLLAGLGALALIRRRPSRN